MFEQRSRKLDILALGLLAAVAFLSASLLTFDQADPPGTLVYPPNQEFHNACGRSGAIVAHVLLQLFGVCAYYAVASLAVLDVILLMRRPIDQPVVRAVGWGMSLWGFSTLVTILAAELSPGVAIGPGGYLGASGAGLLQMHFARAGTLIVAGSVILAGLLLCTDYFLLRMVVVALGLVHRGQGALIHSLARLTGRRVAAQDDLEDEDDQIETVWEDDEEDEYEDDAEMEQDEPAEKKPPLRIRTAAASEDSPKPAANKAVKNRLAAALTIRRGRSSDVAARDAVKARLDAASTGEAEANYELPSLELLEPGEEYHYERHEQEVRARAKVLERTFANFGFQVRVVAVDTGPVIAQYEVQLQAGLRLSKITGLADDLAIALRVPSVRIVAPIPGKNTVGIEVPNKTRQMVRLREVIEQAQDADHRMKVPIFLGKDVSGGPMVVDLADMPHLLIAGRTGTGKSVCLNSIIVSMLMTRRPDEVRLLMIDPKMVELSPYKTLPHLMHPVVTDMQKAEAILAWAVEKMEERYALLARAGVRHISTYNQLGEEELMERLEVEDDQERENIPTTLPFIVIVADEIADMMMTAGKEVEHHIIRLAQKSRAVGIHLVLATQKPTVDVITGLIKSNLPARLAFQVSSRTDSRVVLDEMGADKLLGAGDMLFLQPGTSLLLRGQGTYLSDEEINAVIGAIGTDRPQFVPELVKLKTKDEQTVGPEMLRRRDELYESAIEVVVREGRGSVSLLQRTLGIGYGRAARLIDYMAEDGIVGEYNGSQAREVLLSPEDWASMQGQQEPEYQADGSQQATPSAALPSSPATAAGVEQGFDEESYEDELDAADDEADEESEDQPYDDEAAEAGADDVVGGGEEEEEYEYEYEYEYEDVPADEQEEWESVEQ